MKITVYKVGAQSWYWRVAPSRGGRVYCESTKPFESERVALASAKGFLKKLRSSVPEVVVQREAA